MPPVTDSSGLETFDMEEDEEHHSLIELRSRGRQRRPLGSSVVVADTPSRFGGSRKCLWLTILFILALVGVYHLGLEEGKVEADQDTEDKENKLVAGKEKDEDADIGQVEPKLDTTPEPTPQGTFTLEMLQATRSEGEKILKMLENYYFGGAQTQKMLVESWIDPWDFDAPENMTAKRDRADKLVDTMARALVTDDQKVFLMGAIGSSVVAGHDK